MINYVWNSQSVALCSGAHQLLAILCAAGAHSSASVAAPRRRPYH